MAESARLLHLDPATIAPDPNNVRRDGPGDLDGLAASIRSHGLLQPLGVAREANGYRVVYGSRRREAAVRAGLRSVPCLLVEVPREQHVVQQLLENVQRRDLNPIDQAAGLARLRAALGREQPSLEGRALDGAVGERVGLSASTVRRYLGLLELAPAVQEIVHAGELGVTQAQHLGGVDDPLRQEGLARLAVERDLSAAVMARACRAARARPNLPLADAVSLAERGAEVEPQVVERTNEPARLPSRPRAESSADEDAELWGAEARAEEPADERGMPGGPTTADGNRRFRIRTVSAFCDEVDRLARCLQEGDLDRALGREPEAVGRLRLALRQIDYLEHELGALLEGHARSA